MALIPKRSLLFITVDPCRFGQLNEGIHLGYFSVAVTEYLTKSSLEEKRTYSSRVIQLITVGNAQSITAAG